MVFPSHHHTTNGDGGSHHDTPPLGHRPATHSGILCSSTIAALGGGGGGGGHPPYLSPATAARVKLARGSRLEGPSGAGPTIACHAPPLCAPPLGKVVGPTVVLLWCIAM